MPNFVANNKPLLIKNLYLCNLVWVWPDFRIGDTIIKAKLGYKMKKKSL